jgi:formylglycine-generating enzyme required for sulfatase activity
MDTHAAYAPDRNPPGPAAGAFRVIRGGSWLGAIRGTIDALRISNRYSYSPHLRFTFTGFRCARSVAAQVAG